MNKKKIAFEIGMIVAVLAVLTVSAVPAVNAATAYFDPQHSNASEGGYEWVYLYVDIGEGETLLSGQMQIQFDPAHANITWCSKGCPSPAEGEHCWESVTKNFAFTENGSMWGVVDGPQVAKWDPYDEKWVWGDAPGGYLTGPMTVRICKYRVEPKGTPGASPFDFGFELFPERCILCQPCKFNGDGGVPIANMTWINGTFTYLGVEETFSKPLEPGWNLVSLPLTATDMTVTNVIDTSLSGSYDALYKYDASAHSFVPLSSSDTMDNGVGYFINMTAADTWTYTGAAYESIEVGLSKGLNCAGWTNTSANLPGALNSIAGKYNYVARWNASEQIYQVYEPHAPEPQTGMFNEFWTMDRGEGYWIATKESCTLTYPQP